MSKTGKHIPKQAAAWVLTAALSAAAVVPAGAETIGDGVRPTFDEAYYAMLDYYGNLTEGSVVKSYRLNGAQSLTDYGVYEQVVNLTDGTAPVQTGDKTEFSFSGDNVPSRFYFEGKTTKPFENLPWTLSIHYTLNGVPTKAEDLAGQTGVVEILVDAIPNKAASEYAQNNYTLEAMAVFNQDDILSLEAPGAQVQLVGNLRAVLFVALPGEEQHMTIRVGAEDFSFGGMTFLMVPATLSQLEEISKLSQRKDDLEENYHKLSGSLDSLLDSLNTMSGSLYDTAAGLEQLNAARETVSEGKGTLYDGADTLRADMTGLAALLDPLSQQITAASEVVANSKPVVNSLLDTAVSLQTELAELESTLSDWEKNGTGDVSRLLIQMSNMQGSLSQMQDSLNDMERIPTIESPLAGQDVAQIQANLPLVKQLDASWQQSGGGVDFYTFTCEALWQNYAAEHGITTETPGYAQYRQAFLEQGGAESAKKLDAVHSAWAPDPEGFEFLLEHSDTLDDLLSKINATTGSVNGTIQSVTGPTAQVVGNLSDLCDEIDELNNLVKDSKDPAGALRKASAKVRAILDDVSALQGILNDYEPTLQETLSSLTELTDRLAQTLRDGEKSAGDTETLLRSAGGDLDEGTKKTLEGLAQSLRAGADSLGQTGGVRTAKNAIGDVIEDTWEELTGETNNLLLMDANAEAQSLTDSRNPAPESVQVLIRTQEIQVEDSTESETETQTAAKTTFWGRVAQMFRDFWAAITGLFH